MHLFTDMHSLKVTGSVRVTHRSRRGGSGGRWCNSWSCENAERFTLHPNQGIMYPIYSTFPPKPKTCSRHCKAASSIRVFPLCWEKLFIKPRVRVTIVPNAFLFTSSDHTRFNNTTLHPEGKGMARTHIMYLLPHRNSILSIEIH